MLETTPKTKTYTLTARFSNSAFGECLSGKDAVNPFRFVGGFGGQTDDATGLVYFWNRWYDPQVGRWVSEDPIRHLSDNMNLYGYVQNNPATFLDFLGLFTYKKGVAPIPADLAKMVECLERVLGISLVVTGGGEKTGHSEGSQHYVGKAVDLGWGSNPTIGPKFPGMEKKFYCAAKECGFEFGQNEYGVSGHYHLQSVKGRKGGRGSIPEKPCCDEKK
jgi:RHS repeat-associated protein